MEDDATAARPTIYVDADACPVKNEVYRVAERCGIPVVLVANSSMWVPENSAVRLVLADNAMDAADDWIVDHVVRLDIVVTNDIILASRVLQKGAFALTPQGREFDERSIGDALGTREMLSQLRENGLISKGPAPFTAKDRSAFLQRLDAIVHRCLRG